MTQEELMTLRLPRLQQIADRHGLEWRNVHGVGLHLRKRELVSLLAQRLETKAPPPLPRRIYRVIRLTDGVPIASFGEMVYAGIFWRGLCQVNDAAKLKFRLEEVIER